MEEENVIKFLKSKEMERPIKKKEKKQSWLTINRTEPVWL